MLFDSGMKPICDTRITGAPAPDATIATLARRSVTAAARWQIGDPVSLTLVAGPAEEPVSLAEAKAALRIDGDSSDADIEALISSARESAEHETGRSLMPQTWRVELDDWPAGGAVALGRSPVASLVGAEYWDGSDWQPVPAPVLLRSGERWSVVPALGANWPTPGLGLGARCRVTFVAGYADAAAVPASIKRWIIAQVGGWYANPEAVGTVFQKESPFLAALLQPHRLYGP
ncbi:MAG: hypothetical protein EOP38_25295 [Rubrivivax sp.]|nr:MAG: hypothetical protein EOP38_25295 [Rubrivivax sp.]